MASLQTRISDLITRVGTEFKTIRTLISGSGTGDVSSLATTATNLVGAINEVKTTADAAGGGLSDIVDDTSPQLGGMLDVNGNAIGDGTLEILAFSETASAVNEVTIANAATGNGPSISATGDDTNIDLNLAGKGSGTVKAGGNTVLTTANLLDEDNFASDSATAAPSQQSTKAYVDAALAALVDSSPAALDTLNELAAALGDDADFAGTVTTALGTKANSSDVYTQAQLGDPDTNLVTLFNAALT